MWMNHHPAGVRLSKYDRETTVKQMQVQLQIKYSRSRWGRQRDRDIGR